MSRGAAEAPFVQQPDLSAALGEGGLGSELAVERAVEQLLFSGLGPVAGGRGGQGEEPATVGLGSVAGCPASRQHGTP